MISESDHDALPEGWRRRVCQRTKGRSAGRCDVYLYTPSGQRLRSRREVAAFLRISLSTLPQHFNLKPPRSVTRSASTDVPGEDKAPPASRSLPAADNKPSTSSASAQNEGRVLLAGDSGEKGSFTEAAAVSTSSEDSTMARPNLRTEGRAYEVPLNDGIEAVASRKKESAALERPVELGALCPKMRQD
nr:methyl-CpG-binding protein 2-like [Rhipicephalus microplus]